MVESSLVVDTPGEPPVVAEARSLLALANHDPQRAVDEATRLIDRRAPGGDAPGADAAAVAVAMRARGLAAAKLDRLDASLADLAAAVDLVRRTGDRTLLGEIRMSQAGVLGFAGETGPALAAIAEAARLLDGERLARVRVQRSTILYRAGDLDGALADLEAAAPAIEASGDEVWEAHLRINRGIVVGSRGDAATAETDIVRARELLLRNHQESAAAEAAHNLGWVATVAGDIPMALRHLDEAEDEYRRHGHGLGEVWRDRSRALVSAHLTAEARQLAEDAVAQLAAGTGAAHAEALLDLARAAMLDGDDTRGHQTATAAYEAFVAQGRPAWAALARHLAIGARTRLEDPDRTDLSEVETIADDLERAGLLREAVHARLLLLRLAVRTGAGEMARRWAPVAVSATRHGPVDLRVDAWSALATLREGAGNTRGALAAARAGLRVVDRYRATLGAAEMRVAVSGHADHLAAVGLAAAYRSERPERIFSWMERTRAGALRFPAVTPPDDPELAGALAELRRLDRHRPAGPLADPAAARRRVALQELIRRRSRSLPGAVAVSGEEISLDRVTSRLGAAATLVEIGRFAGRYQGVAVTAGGAVFRELGDHDEVLSAIDGLRFGLSRLAQRRGSRASRHAAAEIVTTATADLERMLLAPLPISGGPVIVVPPAELHSIPWGLLPSLRDRPVTVAPSARLWVERGGRRRGAAGVVVANGPDLPGAAAETRAVAALHPGATRLTARHSAVAAVVAAMDGAGLAHLVAHGSFRGDNPLFSSLRLGDGGLTVYDLERIRHVPELIVLSACNSGIQAVRPGNETMGLVAALLAAGCRTVIASTGLVPDTARTTGTMVELHRLMVDGRSPAEALAEAQGGALAKGPTGLAVAPFVCFGAG